MAQKQTQTHTSDTPASGIEFKNAAGPIDYQMTNDYMFHAVLQQNRRVLKSLICSLLYLAPKTSDPSRY